MFEFDFTEEKLSELIPKAKFGVGVWFKELEEILPTFEIISVQRVAAFIAQTAHESAGYTALEENLNYSAQGLMRTWPKRFPTLESAQPYHRQPAKIANKVYANRMGNSSEASGDGFRYRGRGLIQLTGRSNYSTFAEYCNISLEEAPTYLETPRGAVHSACWYWYVRDLNPFADIADIEGMTILINGGKIGLADRIKHYNHAIDVLVS
jgi:putative chitinase